MYGSMHPWIHASIDPWIHASMDPWIHGSMHAWMSTLTFQIRHGGFIRRYALLGPQDKESPKVIL